MNQFKTTKVLVDINLVQPNPWNPNTQSKEMFEKEVASIKELGMLGSILVREWGGVYEILDGEHRFKACKELKYTQIPVETLGEISDADAKLLTVLLNNLKGKDDLEKRAKIYEQLSEGQLQLLPFTNEEIENEKALFKFDFSQYDEQTPIDKKKDLLIQVPVPEEVFTLWSKCLEIAKASKKDAVQLLVQMMENYLALEKGASVGQREQEL